MDHHIPDINPATGLPMFGGINVAGNPYGSGGESRLFDDDDDDSPPWDERSPGEKIRTIAVMVIVVGFIGFVMFLA